MLSAVRQSFGFLLEEPEFLQMVRAQADQVTLTSDGNLQRLANPPSGIGRQAGAMRNVEAIDGLHQTANGFLQEVRIAQGMVPEPLGNVGREANVRRGQSMLEV